MDFLPIIIMIDYGIMMVSMSIGTYGFGYILHWKIFRNSTSKGEMSLCMLLYIFSEFCFCALALPHIIYLAFLWKLDIPAYNSYWIYGTALPQTFFILITPITVFFLGLDRCLCLLLPYKNRKHISKMVFCIALAVIAIFCVINFTWYILPAFPSSASTECRSSGCLASVESAKVFSALRYITSISNVCIGIILIKLVRKKIIAKNALTKKNNRLAVVTLLMALLLDFLPQLINFSLTTFKDIVLTKFLGPYSLLFASINTAICAITYYQTFRRHSLASNIKCVNTTMKNNTKISHLPSSVNTTTF